MLNSVLVVFKTFFICTFNASKVTSIYFYMKCGLPAVFIGKPSEWISHFWTVRFFKNRIRAEFRFSAHPYLTVVFDLGLECCPPKLCTNVGQTSQVIGFCQVFTRDTSQTKYSIHIFNKLIDLTYF